MSDNPQVAAVREPTQQGVDPAGGGLGAGGVRALKIAIVVMGVMIGAILLTIVGRVIYLVSSPKIEAVSHIKVPVAGRQLVNVAIPDGARVRRSTLAPGGRLVVEYDGKVNGGVMVVDVASGRVVRHIRFTQDQRTLSPSTQK